MGSSYFGEPNMGNNERASSSRKGKKNNNSEKPRQPQRGLGVAQLEKIRLHSQMAYGAFHPTTLHHHASFQSNEDPRVQMAYSSSSPPPPPSSTSYGFQPSIMMGVADEYEKTNMRYGDYRLTNTAARLEQANAILENQCSAHHSNITIPFLHLYDSRDIDSSKKHRGGSMGSSSHNSESSDTQELDLELKLSL